MADCKCKIALLCDLLIVACLPYGQLVELRVEYNGRLMRRKRKEEERKRVKCMEVRDTHLGRNTVFVSSGGVIPVKSLWHDSKCCRREKRTQVRAFAFRERVPRLDVQDTFL